MRSNGLTPRKHSKVKRQLNAQASLIAHPRGRHRMARKEAVLSPSMELEGVPKFPIPKTMKLHSVVAHQCTLVSRDVSCFDTCCWQDGVFQPTCPGWVTHVHLVPREEPPQNNQGTTTEPPQNHKRKQSRSHHLHQHLRRNQSRLRISNLTRPNWNRIGTWATLLRQSTMEKHLPVK